MTTQTTPVVEGRAIVQDDAIKRRVDALWAELGID